MIQFDGAVIPRANVLSELQTGGEMETRTPNLFVASELLYQLSYNPVCYVFYNAQPLPS